MSSCCKSCQLNNFTNNEYDEKICTNCGDVQEELVDDDRLCILADNEAVVDSYRNKNYEANQRLTARIRGETNSADNKRLITREKLLNDMRRNVAQIIKHPSAVEETMELVKSTFQAHKGRLLHNKKLGLVGACVYYLSAKHQLSISLTDICKAFNVKMKIISVCLKQVKQLCPNFEYERPNIKDLVKKHIHELATKHYDLNSFDQVSTTNKSESTPRRPSEPQPLIDSKDRLVLENRVMLLIELFEAMHPYNQPTPQSLIVAVIYHAWRSLDTFKMIAVNLSDGLQGISRPEATREINDLEDYQSQPKTTRVKHSIGFERFCQICNLKYSSNGYKIVSKLQSSLLELGKYLGDVNKINLPWFLKDIIENSPHLIQEHMRTEFTIKDSPPKESSAKSNVTQDKPLET